MREIEGIGRGEGNGTNGRKNEWCLWRLGCVGEVHGWRTEVTEIEIIDGRMTQAAEESVSGSLNKA